jgi:hypothetical protein
MATFEPAGMLSRLYPPTSIELMHALFQKEYLSAQYSSVSMIG